jgi:predicted porin
MIFKFPNMNLKTFMTAPVLCLLAELAYAQSSVALYGIVDTGVTYRSNESTGSHGFNVGHSNFVLSSGNLNGSRWGVKGREELGDGWSTLFLLENGFDSTNGTMGQNGRLFGREAFVGLSNDSYGTVSMGRQYSSLDDFVLPVSPMPYTGGMGAHPGDIDDLDQTVRVDNSVKYTSATFSGFSLGALYGFGDQAGSIKRKSTWSVAAGYSRGPIRLGVGYERSDNSKTGPSDPTVGTWNSSDDGTFNSAISEGYASAQTQEILATGLTYDLGTVLLGANYSNVQYKPGADSSFSSPAVFNIAGIFSQWKIKPQFHVITGYSYTRANAMAGISDRAQYHNVNVGLLYDLGTRSTIYLLGGFQRARGETLNVLGIPVNATASVSDKGNGHSSASRSQVIVSLGLRQKF